MEPKASKNPEFVVRDIKRKTRRKFNFEEKIKAQLQVVSKDSRFFTVLFTLWASLSATTQQVGKVDNTPSSLLASVRSPPKISGGRLYSWRRGLEAFSTFATLEFT